MTSTGAGMAARVRREVGIADGCAAAAQPSVDVAVIAR
jgi:hypothetical protein